MASEAGCPESPLQPWVCNPKILGGGWGVEGVVLESPASCSFLLPEQVVTLQVSHKQSFSMDYKVILALGDNVCCCLQVGGIKENPVLVQYPA